MVLKIDVILKNDMLQICVSVEFKMFLHYLWILDMYIPSGSKEHSYRLVAKMIDLIRYETILSGLFKRNDYNPFN